MLMVVFGAGASYDSVPSYPPDTPEHRNLLARPPLADGLFDDRELFSDVLARFPRCIPIIPLLRHRRPPNRPVEQILESFQTEAQDYPERHRQLAAIRYYLQVAINNCENQWNAIAGGPTNYITLLDKIRRWRKAVQRVCLVTFNYDRMLETALSTVGIKIGKLNHYIANDDCKIIKLHGSVNWAREVYTPIENINNLNDQQVIDELIEQSPNLDISPKYRMVEVCPAVKSDRGALYPALAIPVETKKGYECPQEQLEALEACIPEVTKLLIIGWRAADAPFLKLLADKLPRHIFSAMVVAGSREQASEVVERMQKTGIKGKEFLRAKGGFTDFILNREADDFLTS